MRKINKLEISPEKIMKNDELINLKGGVAILCGCIDVYNDVIWGTGYCGGYSSCKACAEALSTLYGTKIACVEI